MTIDSTLGGVSANSYVSYAESLAYMATRVGAAKWVDLDQSEAEAYLITAARQLELAQWNGFKATKVQALSWPRTQVYDYENNLIEDIPVKLKNAQCELAFWYFTEPDRFLSDTDLTQISSLSAGPLDIKVNGKPQLYPAIVDQILNAIGPGLLLVSANNNTYTPVRFVI